VADLSDSRIKRLYFAKPAEREARRLQRETGSRAAVSQASTLKPRSERRSLQDENVRQMERDFQAGETGRSGRLPLR
jgi:hypothetical protein